MRSCQSKKSAIGATVFRKRTGSAILTVCVQKERSDIWPGSGTFSDRDTQNLNLKNIARFVNAAHVREAFKNVLADFAR